MRIPRRQLQPFTRPWPVGRLPVWVILIAANVGCFTTQKLIENTDAEWVRSWLALTTTGVASGRYWEFITYSFLHANVLHLLGNMALLYFAGREVEALIGTRHFLGVYFGGGLLGGLVQWAFAMPPGFALIGASACVFSTLLAFTTILPELELSCLLFFVIPIRTRAKFLAIAAFGITALCILVPFIGHVCHVPLIDPTLWVYRLFQPDAEFAIGHHAHLAGCLFGWCYVKQLGYGNPLFIQRYFLDQRQQAERHKNMSSAQFITEEIDPILDKISRDGIKSLSRREKNLLRLSKEKIEQTRSHRSG